MGARSLTCIMIGMVDSEKHTCCRPGYTFSWVSFGGLDFLLECEVVFAVGLSRFFWWGQENLFIHYNIFTGDSINFDQSTLGKV